jgi:hypothetical protein
LSLLTIRELYLSFDSSFSKMATSTFTLLTLDPSAIQRA